jgi:hypothetical protein
MIEIKGCTRCGGDEVVEQLHGEAELVCLQCGHRRDASARPVSLRRAVRGRANRQRPNGLTHSATHPLSGAPAPPPRRGSPCAERRSSGLARGCWRPICRIGKVRFSNQAYELPTRDHPCQQVALPEYPPQG